MISGTSIPASKIYSDAGIVQISPAAINLVYTQQGFKSTYRVVATDAQQGPALADYASKTLHAKSVAIVADATAYGQRLANEFEKRAKANGMSVLSHDATNDKAVDFRAILTKIKGEKPDVIMYGAWMLPAGLLLNRRNNSLSPPRYWVATDYVRQRYRSSLAKPLTMSFVRSLVSHYKKWQVARPLKSDLKPGSAK
jgi:ABC-type branched-subunit amino acid transport system substrate-binding protein